MKKSLCLVMAAVLVLVLTGCNLAEMFEMESEPKVEEMLTALSGGDAEAALALMHPDVADAEAVAQLIDYLDGRQVAEMTRTSIHKGAHAGTDGTRTEESANFQLELDDGTKIALSVVYLSDSNGEGFSTFRIQLG